MGIAFNPFTGQLDITGSGGSTAPRYEAEFNSTTDWGSPSGGIYTYTVLQATHGRTNPNVQVYELSGSDYVEVIMSVKINASGDVLLEVMQTPDNRFAGKVIII